MKKIEINEEELEMMNYNDIAYVILENVNKKMKINDLFTEVSKILKLNEEQYQAYIGDFFELLSTDKRFIMLDDGYWDLKIKHNKGMENFDEDEDDEEIIPIEEETSDDGYDEDEEISEDDDIEDDDLSDLVIVDDIDEENNL